MPAHLMFEKMNSYGYKTNYLIDTLITNYTFIY
ncbi:hypothetical protein SAMN04515668_5004 [Hymenobacter arizonensis]|uniref:Uncharacterized protein n=1 Tax=Hymenobacter arizonensis TaxID=1227077 RepID=A0A1I6BRQ2_HYMAR|nr:hypothetical protein SAMN04515668_5004 [Hymenobacter arizonensis]